MRALDGVRVLDMSRLLPGGFCTMLLSDLGAEVVKIEDPELGDYIRLARPFVKGNSVLHMLLNRNKKSISLNLKSEKGREIFYELCSGYDVIIESFRPGVVSRLGVDFETVRKINPRIIYCSITGFGQNTLHSRLPVHDLNIQAMAGVLSLNGSQCEGPGFPASQSADVGGALFAAITILAALLERRETGVGRYLDISMFECTLFTMITHLANQFGGEKPQRGRQMITGGEPYYNIYKTLDDEYVALAAIEPQFWRNFCHLIGREDLIEKQYEEGRAKEDVFGEVQKVLASKRRDDWLKVFMKEEACLTPVLEVQETLEEAFLAERGIVQEVEHESIGKMRVLGSMPTTGRRDTWNLAPAHGQHTNEILRILGYDEEDIEKLRKEGIV